MTLHRDYTALNVGERNKEGVVGGGGIDLFDMAANSSCRSKDSQSAFVLSKVKELKENQIRFSSLTLCSLIQDIFQSFGTNVATAVYWLVLYM